MARTESAPYYGFQGGPRTRVAYLREERMTTEEAARPPTWRKWSAIHSGWRRVYIAEWSLEWLAHWLERMAIFKILGFVSQLTIIIVAVNWLGGAEARRQAAEDANLAILSQAWALVYGLDPSAPNSGREFAIKLLSERGQLSQQGIKLSALNFDFASLANLTLTVADLSEASFDQADLTHANLSGTKLTKAILTGANLTGAKLFQTILSGANLSDANLSGADLGGADLRGADLGRADLSGADLGRADLSGADLNGAKLFGANLSDAIVTQTQLDVAIGSEDTKLPSGLTLKHKTPPP